MLPFVFFAALLLAVLIAAACNRGPRIPGMSWFDIPHTANRAARRKQGRR